MFTCHHLIGVNKIDRYFGVDFFYSKKNLVVAEQYKLVQYARQVKLTG